MHEKPYEQKRVFTRDLPGYRSLWEEISKIDDDLVYWTRMTEFTKALIARYGREACTQKQLFHLAVGSSIPPELTELDFEGEDSIGALMEEMHNSLPS